MSKQEPTRYGFRNYHGGRYWFQCYNTDCMNVWPSDDNKWSECPRCKSKDVRKVDFRVTQ